MLEKIVVENPEEVERIKARIKKAGKSKFHVLADFDRTLTYSSFKGEKVPSLIAHLRNGKYLTFDYAEKAHKLFDIYRPIEIDSDMSSIEKNFKMAEWWKKHYELLAESGLDESTIKQSVKDILKENKIRLRKGMQEFLKILKENSIPLIIMSSAGIGDMISDFLEKQNLLYDNIYLIGNMMEFDKQGKFTGVKDNRIIHTFNKQEVMIKDLPIYKELEKRKNVLLLGDSLGDLGMVEGFEAENVLKINFLSVDDEQNLDLYKENYDVVLLGDPGFEYINKLVRELISSNK